MRLHNPYNNRWFTVDGQPPNNVVITYYTSADGDAVSARPGSTEELSLYNALVSNALQATAQR